MPYVFPKHRIEPNTPMDYEEVNENFQDLIVPLTSTTSIPVRFRWEFRRFPLRL